MLVCHLYIFLVRCLFISFAYFLIHLFMFLYCVLCIFWVKHFLYQICLLHIFSSSLWLVLGFPGKSAGRESTCNVGELDSVPELGRCPGEGNGYPLQYYGLDNSMNSIVYGVAKSWIRLSDIHFHGLSYSLEIAQFWASLFKFFRCTFWKLLEKSVILVLYSGFPREVLC